MAEDPEFNRLSQLLPFYVNGTLGADETAQVDTALATSAALREELAVIGRLAQGVKTGGRELTQNEEGDLERQAARLEQLNAQPAPVPAPPISAAPRESLGSLLSFLHPKRWHPAVALTLAIAVTAQAVVIGNLNGENAEGTSKIAALEKRLDEVEFQLASGPGGGEVSEASIMVQLKANVSWAEFEKLLADEGLTITGGPSDGTLLLSGDVKGAALNAQIARLRASALIEAADPAV
jgi:anti-sigma factor RsiW